MRCASITAMARAACGLPPQVSRLRPPRPDLAHELAMWRAGLGLVAGLGCLPDFLLLDAAVLPEQRIDQAGLIDGDCRSVSIACASIVAKVERDAIMARLDAVYPGYGFARHKGYGTVEHRAALARL